MARKQNQSLAGMKRRGRPRNKPAVAGRARKKREEEILVEENEDEDEDEDEDEELDSYDEEPQRQELSAPVQRDRPMTEDEERQELLNGLDDEARLQNQTANRVIEMRKNHARVPWHGQDGIKYNYGSEKCMTLFGSSSEVEISLEQPVAHHVGVIPLHQVPNWGKLSEYICNNQWDGTPQKYKIIMYSTGRSIAAVCYLKLGDNPKRRIEWKTIEAQARGVPLPSDPQQAQQPQQQWQDPQQSRSQQQQPRAQQWQDPPQQVQQPQQQWGEPQPQRQHPPQEWLSPQQQGWAQPQLQQSPPQQPQQQWGQPQWPQPQPQMPGWPQQMPWMQPPPPPQDQVDDDDDDEEEEEEFIEDIPPPPPSRMGHNPYQPQQPQPDYRILQLEGTIKGLNRQIKKLQKRNNHDMRSASTQASYQQQFQVWQMLSTLNGSLHSMKQQLEEAKAQAAMQQQPMQQPQMMSMEEIARLVDERLKATEAQQQQIQMQQQMAQWAQMGMPQQQQQQPPPPEPKDSLSEMRKTMKQMAELKEMFEKLSPSSPPVPPPPQMPQWMQQPPPQQALVQSETKAEDGSPLKVFEMGPFRYVTDKDGKAVDFFTMMALNADNVKSWIEPGIKALGELRQHVKDARRQEEMRDTYRMFEQMQQQLMENQQLQAQQIDMLSRRLAPSQSTVDALQSGNAVTVATSPPAPVPVTVSSPSPPSKPAWTEKKVPTQHGPSAKPVVSSGGSKSLLDGIAYAQRALAKTT